MLFIELTSTIWLVWSFKSVLSVLFFMCLIESPLLFTYFKSMSLISFLIGLEFLMEFFLMGGNSRLCSFDKLFSPILDFSCKFDLEFLDLSRDLLYLLSSFGKFILSIWPFGILSVLLISFLMIIQVYAVSVILKLYGSSKKWANVLMLLLLFN